jgi:hypothetical protein
MSQQQMYLPVPTNAEIGLGFKIDYYTRLIEEIDHNRYKITRDEFLDWIHHNYQCVFILGKELSLNEYKKLSK